MTSLFRRLFGRFASQKTSAPREPTPIEEDAELAEIVALLSPPTDRRNPAAWDDYWHRQLSTGLAGMYDMMIDDSHVIALSRKSDFRSALVAGNGISLEPRALAAAGFTVTAMDLSPFALQVAQKIDFADGQLASMIGESGTRPGGSVQYVAGDVFDASVCARPFDVIIERRTAQGYPDGEREAFLSALADRLSPEGILVSHCHDGSWRPGREPRHVTTDWFKAQGWSILERMPNKKPSGRCLWPVSSTG